MSQNKPIKSENSEKVIDTLLPKIKSDRVKKMLLSRNDLGIKRYSLELMSHNGRDAKQDFAEEIADALMYLEQITLEYRFECAFYKNTRYVLETILAKFLEREKM